MRLSFKQSLCILAVGAAFAARLAGSVPRFTLAHYEDYSIPLRSLVSALGLAGLLLVLLKRPSAESPRALTLSFWMVVGLIVAQALAVNPAGIFPWNQIPVHVVGGARAVKLDLYRHLPEKPQIVVFGSSRAFQIPGEYLEAKLGKKAFNWSVEGGGAVDALTVSRFLASQRATPEVLLVEISSPALESEAWPERTPVTLIPYLPDRQMAYEAVKQEVDSLFGFSTFAEASYTVLHVYGTQKTHPSDFLADGSARGEPTVRASYQQAVVDQTPLYESTLRCRGFNVEGKRATDGLVRFAEQKRMGVVFYVSPLSADFLGRLDERDPDHQQCMKLVEGYMQEVTRRHPNVVYRDLLRYAAISDLRSEGYTDIGHINRRASQQLVDVLQPDLQRALAWRAGD
jgi:hypothetical protein